MALQRAWAALERRLRRSRGGLFLQARSSHQQYDRTSGHMLIHAICVLQSAFIRLPIAVPVLVHSTEK